MRVLGDDPPASEEAIRTAAAAAVWALPRALAALVTRPPGGGERPGAAPPAGGPDASSVGRLDAATGGPDAGATEEVLDASAAALARRIGSGAIGAGAGGLACVFVPDPDAPGRRRQLEAALDGQAAALGPTVAWAQAGASLRRAASALRLELRGTSLLIADEHLARLLLTADPGLGAELAATRLAPLHGLPEAQRARLTDTLAAWLDRPGQVQAVAAVLGVHPQTVRYRLGRLRELFGERLEDPEARFELGLALRVARMR